MSTKEASRIKALELALQYIPGTDENHSASVLLEMIEEMKEEELVCHH
ncbi:MAG TPA: hypothetical protein GXX75_04665 [Clostridiales bacterium]|nr:hypothetical protein [Clostridiales bacterium]